jgi:hypothetical protein
VIVEPGTKSAYLDPTLGWLSAAHPLAYVFHNTIDGYKVLFTDGIFAEFAVFEEHELPRIAYAPGRIIWKKPGVSGSVALPLRFATPSEHDVGYLVGEALTALHVGLNRELRGEHLAALRFIQQQAVDRVIELADLGNPTGDPMLQDSFARERRVERRHPLLARELPLFMPGYHRNIPAARALLGWLDRHAEVSPVMSNAILALCAEEKPPS